MRKANGETDRKEFGGHNMLNPRRDTNSPQEGGSGSTIRKDLMGKISMTKKRLIR